MGPQGRGWAPRLVMARESGAALPLTPQAGQPKAGPGEQAPSPGPGLRAQGAMEGLRSVGPEAPPAGPAALGCGGIWGPVPPQSGRWTSARPTAQQAPLEGDRALPHMPPAVPGQGAALPCAACSAQVDPLCRSPRPGFSRYHRLVSRQKSILAPGAPGLGRVHRHRAGGAWAAAQAAPVPWPQPCRRSAADSSCPRPWPSLLPAAPRCP